MYAAGSTAESIEWSAGMDFERYVIDSRQRLYRFAVVLCGDTVLAGDLLGDVLGKAFERWESVSAARDPHAYVRRMLVNEFISWQRRRARTVPHGEAGHLADLRADRFGQTVPDPGDTHAERSVLLADLARLPARQRAAIVLRYYADLSDDDIATTLRCRTGTVRSLISRGLAALRVSRNASEERTTP